MKQENQLYYIAQIADIIKSKYKIDVFCGVEVEFYLTCVKNHLVEEEKAKGFIESAAKKFDIKIKKESGFNQYEFDSDIFLINQANYFLKINKIKSSLQFYAQENGLMINYHPKPFIFDYGSAMHFNLNLKKKGCNIFDQNAIDENKPLLSLIAAILKLLNQSLYLIFNNEEEFTRLYQQDELKQKVTPTNLSWGGNNRTTMIRIPDRLPTCLEFRLPSANSNIIGVMMFLLTSIYYSIIHDDITPPQRCYGNAYQYRYSSICKNLLEAKKCFSLNKIIDHSLSL